MTWACEECGWEWPYRGEEAWAWAECDSCGGRLVEQDDQDDRMADLLAAAYLSGDREERPAQCPECGSDDPATRLPVKRPEVHIEGGARVCRFCNRTLTFNFMRNDGGDCDCARAVEDAACSGSWHDVEVSR